MARPAHQATGLMERLRHRNLEPIACPAIEIVPPADAGRLSLALAHHGDWGLAIFTSANAVACGLGHLTRRRSDLTMAAIGPGTAGALRRLGVRVDLLPSSGIGSEGLLRLPALAAARVRGQRVGIVKGEGGRDLLRESLVRRRARVDVVEVYRRQRPRGLSPELIAAGRAGRVAALVATSGEAVENILALVADADRSWLDRAWLVVPSERVATVARAAGARAPIAVAAPSDAALVETVGEVLGQRGGARQ